MPDKRIESYLSLTDETGAEDVGLVHRRFLRCHAVVKFLQSSQKKKNSRSIDKFINFSPIHSSYGCAVQLRFSLDTILDGRHFVDLFAHGVHPRVIHLRHGRVPFQVFESRLATLESVDKSHVQNSIS